MKDEYAVSGASINYKIDVVFVIHILLLIP